jgi:hypothetical protein
MQSLLSPDRRPDPVRIAPPQAAVSATLPTRPRVGLTLNPEQTAELAALQSALRENGIVASQEELASALLGSVLERPGLAKGLLAAFLTGS